MNPLWFMRIPFAAVFAGHGVVELFMPSASAQMPDLPLALAFLLGARSRA